MALLFGTATGTEAFAQGGDAPGGPGETAVWTTGAKQGVGTSTGMRSKVWYTLAEGVLSEVYYPRVDVANVKDLEFIITDGKSFTDREREDTRHKVELTDSKALVYRQVNTAKSGKYRITKTYITDPSRDTLLTQVKFESLDGGDYRLYAMFDPSLGNSGSGDSGLPSGDALTASDGNIASALVSSVGFSITSNGFKGRSDGWADLREDHQMDWDYSAARNGNVVQTAEIPLNKGKRAGEFTLALGFGKDINGALKTARDSLKQPFKRKESLYRAGWHRYLASLKPPKKLDASLKRQYQAAVMMLKAHEDKTYRGANIASLTIPWGEAVQADKPDVGGYHLVWSRDLYQVATAMIAAGDKKAAKRALRYLLEVQQKPDGSFPQNSRMDGTPYWTGLQLDQVAYPLILAWQLGETDKSTYEKQLKPAADLIVRKGPSTPQERWEEEGGYSPSTIAAEIAGLIAVADIAEKNGDPASADLYRGVADHWQKNVEKWIFTRTGPHGDGKYYLRIDDNGEPDDGGRLEINNGGGTYDEREIVDAGFLELVRLGVKAAADPSITASLPELDQTIQVDTPNGPMWYRYNHDGYGEKKDGSPYDGTGVGRLWPFLTGERGEFELAAGRQADRHLATMAKAANDGWLIPEQVWDQPDNPEKKLTFGEGTGSATPLAWSMAQFVRLAHSIEEGEPVERPSIVAERYAKGQLPAGPSLQVTEPTLGSVTKEQAIRVKGTTDGERVVVFASEEAQEAKVKEGRFELEIPLELGTNTLRVVAVGKNGGTSMKEVAVVSEFFGKKIGKRLDPTGDDKGPGTYVYPASAAFDEGAFDLTSFEAFDAGKEVRFVTSIAGELKNPWGGNEISVQRLNIYLRAEGSKSDESVPALRGTYAQMAAPYDYVVTVDGFEELGVRDADGNHVSDATLLAVTGSRQIVVSVPKKAFSGLDFSRVGYGVVMLSHAGGDEGEGFIRPVYSRKYWDSTKGTAMDWIREYRFGGGEGEYDGSRPSKDTDTRDPNILDLIVGDGQDQRIVLDYTQNTPVSIPYVTLEH
ncbi:glucan 1,4-alpha-glucosidase [Salinithrix halophila]|uniref:Glucan 1,4-alpha-glucosidase n=1 Tax=Salinithrix halophila TaxID=1485204 RepID=A0ABV8JDU6_9BACL